MESHTKNGHQILKIRRGVLRFLIKLWMWIQLDWERCFCCVKRICTSRQGRNKDLQRNVEIIKEGGGLLMFKFHASVHSEFELKAWVISSCATQAQPLESIRLHQVTACTLAINQICLLAGIFLILPIWDAAWPPRAPEQCLHYCAVTKPCSPAPGLPGPQGFICINRGYSTSVLTPAWRTWPPAALKDCAQLYTGAEASELLAATAFRERIHPCLEWKKELSSIPPIPHPFPPPLLMPQGTERTVGCLVCNWRVWWEETQDFSCCTSLFV